MTTDTAGFRQLEGETLPIFTRELDDLTLFYAPGYLAAAREKEAQEILDILSGEIPFGIPVPHYLVRAAASAESSWAMRHDPERYEPTCLTIYTSPECNLNCVYCFAKQSHTAAVKLDRDLIFSSAMDVLTNCEEKGVPFTAVFHGGGEPSLDPRLPEILDELRRYSGSVSVPFYAYIATNGVMSEEKAVWIAENFNEAGLSVDGPPDLQNAQRPTASGGESAAVTERTAAIFRDIMGHLTVRVTVMSGNFSRISEIAAYCAETLHADEIHMEPAYRREGGYGLDQAEIFCGQFLEAKQMCKKAGVSLSYSGSRLNEIHGRYCQIFRQVLHLVPPGGISPCFVLSTEEEVGRVWPGADTDELSVFNKLITEDPACRDCFNRFHCARGCPDVCPALTAETRDAGSFRCRVNRILAEAEIMDQARQHLTGYARQYGFCGITLREDPWPEKNSI